MPTYGLTTDDNVLDGSGNALTGTWVRLYPTEADALAKTNELAATQSLAGRWSLEADQDPVWARVERSTGPNIYRLSISASSADVEAAVAPVRQQVEAQALELADKAPQSALDQVVADLQAKASQQALEALQTGKLDKDEAGQTYLAKSDAISTFEPRLFTPAVDFAPLPGQVSGQTRYNGVSYNQDSVLTDGGYQFAVWYNQSGALLIGKREVGSKAWATFDLSTIAGNPLALPVDTDSHNNASIGVDASGRLHVAANMHGDALRYVRSNNPGDITSWAAPGMVGTVETQVTYPRFATHPDGTLFFLYRDGASGMGDLHLNSYDVNGGVWSRVGMVAQGKPTSENPYESRFAISRDGTLALAVTWRPNGGDHNSNNDVHYIQSADKGVTWTSVDGQAVALPLLHANTTALALDTAATNSGIINQFGLDLDTENRPHIALTLADGTTPDRNVHHLYWDGSAWVNQQVTDLGNGMGYNDMPTRPAVACTNDGRTLLLTSFPRLLNGRQGSFRLIDVTDGAATDVPVANLDGRDFEVTFDTHALRDRNALSFMVSQANGEVTAPGPEYWALNNWDRQWAGVVTVDLAQVGAVLRGEAAVPRIRTVAVLNTPNNVSVTGTSDAILTGSGGLLTTPELRGRQVFARLTGRASVNAGTLTLSVFEVQQGGTSRLFGSIPFTASSTVIRATPWMPLQYGPVGGIDALLQVLGRVTSGNTGTVSTAVLELGVID